MKTAVINLKDNHGKDGLDAVGRLVVWVNGKKVMDKGSQHTGDLKEPQPGSKRIIGLHVSADNIPFQLPLRHPLFKGKILKRVHRLTRLQGYSRNQLKKPEKGPVETIEFFYLESKIMSATMSEITYEEQLDKYNSEQKGVENNHSLDSMWFYNDNDPGSFNQTFSQTDTFSWTNSKAISSAQTHTVGGSFGAETKISAGIPGLVQGETKFSAEVKYEYQNMHSDTDTTSDTHSMAYSTGSPCKSCLDMGSNVLN